MAGVGFFFTFFVLISIQFQVLFFDLRINGLAKVV